MATKSIGRLVAGGFLLSAALTGCVSQGSYDRLKTENTQLQQQVSAQSAQIASQQNQAAANQAELSSHKTQISRLQGAIKYTIESDLLFPTGSWELSTEGKDTIAKMATKLAPTQQNKIVVNGYTDSAPIGPALERQGITSNEVLSQKRADAVRQFLISRGMRSDLVSAVGHGESNPIAQNDTPEGRSQNRRVELTLGG